MPFRSEIFHPNACLFFLRRCRRLCSCAVVSSEEITTGYCSFASKNAYFNSAWEGFEFYLLRFLGFIANQ